MVPAGTARTAGSTLHRLRDLDEPVLVDCPAGASPAAADPLRIADETALVSTAHPESLVDVAKTAAIARTLGTPPVGAVLTRTARSHPVGSLLDCPLLGTVPDVADDALGASAVRSAYRSVATTLLEQNT
ncbi:hypothetical protein VB779_05755 [Haloarculaceae archaeon H-GB11]|nr:hypothetical protein [Haloarculaceae archaeon H-GB11]